MVAMFGRTKDGKAISRWKRCVEGGSKGGVIRSLVYNSCLYELQYMSCPREGC